MTLQEAMAIMLMLQHAKRTEFEEKIYNIAWGIICAEAEAAMRRFRP